MLRPPSSLTTGAARALAGTTDSGCSRCPSRCASCAREPAWTSWIGGLVVRAIGAWQRRTARKRGLRTPLTGVVTSVQRFGGLVNLDVHFHLVVPDGVFVESDEGLRFEMLPVPTNTNVLAILDRIMRQLARRLAKDATNGQ